MLGGLCLVAAPAGAEVRSRGESLLLRHNSGAELELQLRARLGSAPASGDAATAKPAGASPGPKTSDAPTAVPAIKFYPFTSWRADGEEQVSEVVAATGMRLQIHVREEADGRFAVRMDASATAPAWVGLLSLEAEVNATDAQVAGRDLRPYHVDRVAALSGLDPKWVIFKPAPPSSADGGGSEPAGDAWTVVLDDQADGLKVHRERTRLLLQADLLSTEARPFSHFINCTDNWRSPNHRVALPTRQLQEGEALSVNMSLYAGGAVPLFKARYPEGRSAALVITDHADQTAAPTLRALAGGTSDTAAPGWGKGGLLGNGLLITKALWLSSGEPAPAPLWSHPVVVAPPPMLAAVPPPTLGPGKRARSGKPSKSLQAFRLRYERPQVDPTGGGRPQLDDPEVAELAERLSRAGWELSPHSATPLRDERERTEEALQFFERWKSRTWIDHQPYTNCEALINRGYQGGEFGIVDLLSQHGYGYAWSGIDIPPSAELNLLSPHHLEHYMPVLWPAGRLWPGMPASLWLFSSMMTYMDSAKFFTLYKKKALDQLERERGLHIAHTYLEAFHPPGSMFARRNLMVPGRHTGEIVPHPKLAELFQQLAARVHRGSLWVPTLQQLGDHMRAMAGVTVRLGNDGSATLRAERALTGATFVVPAPNLRVMIDGQPAKGTTHTKTETTFWADLPEGKSVRVELLDPSGKPLAILRPPARKSLLAGLPPPVQTPRPQAPSASSKRPATGQWAAGRL